MTRFVHTSDWQLGMTRHFLDPDAQARFSCARIDAVRRIGRLALDEGCPFVVVSGDVFETNHVDRQTVVRALDAMAATPGVVFYLLPGNHDPLDAASVFRSATFVQRRPDNVVVIEDSEPLDTGHGIEIVGAPWFNKRPLVDLVADATAGLAADGTRRVVIGHGAIDFFTPERDDPSLIDRSTLETAIAQGRISYVALGDRHSATDVGPSGRIRYSGAPEPTDFNETDPGKVLVVEIEADEVRVEARSIGTWTFVRETFDVAGSVDVDRVESFLAGLDDKDRTIVRLALVGQLSLGEKARLDEVLAHHADLLGALDLWQQRSELVVLPDAADDAILDLRGFASDALADLRAAAEREGSQSLVAREALAVLYRLGRAS